ncbi:MAG: hypothetical protein GC136_03725 [Alphaproteobacteria bacterium]|nr:hypothetical protein [Alphaproteobacteria bacterium]
MSAFKPTDYLDSAFPRVDISEVKPWDIPRFVITQKGLGLGLASGFKDGRNQVLVRQHIGGRVKEVYHLATGVTLDNGIPKGYNTDGTMPPNAVFERTEGDGRRLVVTADWAPRPRT